MCLCKRKNSINKSLCNLLLSEETATVEDLNEAIVSQTSSTTHTTEAHPSTSQDTPTTSSKRPREDSDQ